MLVLVYFYIGFIMDSMKVISAGDKPYFAYSCASISTMLLLQSISLLSVKSCIGINRKTSWDTCIVPLPKNSKILKKFVCIYLWQFNCSKEVLNGPIIKNVSVHTEFLSPIIVSGGLTAFVE